MRTTAHLRRGRHLFISLIAAWALASTLTVTRSLSTPAFALNEPARPVPVEQVRETEPPPAKTPASGETQQEKRGILPPWHENWIPEMRHQPGKHARKTAA